jgi:hypothetical protein
MSAVPPEADRAPSARDAHQVRAPSRYHNQLIPAAPTSETTPEAPAQSASKTDIPAAVEQTPADDAPRQDNGGAQIVSLDAFRKK